jgi:hypothetical protein
MTVRGHRSVVGKQGIGEKRSQGQRKCNQGRGGKRKDTRWGAIFGEVRLNVNVQAKGRGVPRVGGRVVLVRMAPGSSTVGRRSAPSTSCNIFRVLYCTSIDSRVLKHTSSGPGCIYTLHTYECQQTTCTSQMIKIMVRAKELILLVGSGKAPRLDTCPKLLMMTPKLFSY